MKCTVSSTGTFDAKQSLFSLNIKAQSVYGFSSSVFQPQFCHSLHSEPWVNLLILQILGKALSDKQTWLCCTKSFPHSPVLSWSLWAAAEEGHLHFGNDGNPRHMELGFLTHRDCTGRVTEIQTKPYSPGVHTQLPREQKFSPSPAPAFGWYFRRTTSCESDWEVWLIW